MGFSFLCPFRTAFLSWIIRRRAETPAVAQRYVFGIIVKGDRSRFHFDSAVLLLMAN